MKLGGSRDMNNRGIAIATPRSRSDWVKVAVDFSPRVDRKIAWRRGATLARRLAAWRTKVFNRRSATAPAPGSGRGLKSTATFVPSLRDSAPACGATEKHEEPPISSPLPLPKVTVHSPQQRFGEAVRDDFRDRRYACPTAGHFADLTLFGS